MSQHALHACIYGLKPIEAGKCTDIVQQRKIFQRSARRHESEADMFEQLGYQYESNSHRNSFLAAAKDCVMAFSLAPGSSPLVRTSSAP
jgi:alkyl sulfatase BDS1-like metallo-beta-lactamase superfamily hydrolase